MTAFLLSEESGLLQFKACVWESMESWRLATTAGNNSSL